MANQDVTITFRGTDAGLGQSLSAYRKGLEGINTAAADAAKSTADLSKAFISSSAALKQSNSEAIALAKSLGGSINDAKAFAASINLSASAAAQAVARYREFQSVGATTAQTFRALKGELGISKDQFLQLSQGVKVANERIEASAAAAKGLAGVFQGLAVGAGISAFGAIQNAVVGLPQSIAASTLQFEKFNTVLTTLFGDQAKAKEAFGTIQDFAATTPFQLDEVLQAFISLKNRGIDPTNETLTRLGDIASSQGKSLQQITEAVLDASVGEFERLKEFGIQASSEGNKVKLTFKGVTQEIEKTPDAITGAILKLGELKGVAGGMEAQSKTLGGQLSNLQDNVTKLSVEFGNELIPVLVDFVNTLNESLPLLLNFARASGEVTANLLKGFGNVVGSLQQAADEFGFLTGAVGESADAADAFGRATDQALQEAVQAETQYKAAIEARNAAKAAGRGLTADEAKEQQQAAQAIQGSIAGIQAQIKELDQAVLVGKENRANIESQKEALKARLAALQADAKALGLNTQATNTNAGSQKSLKEQIDDVNNAYEKRQAVIVQGEARSLSEVARLQEQGVIDKQEAEKRKLQITQDRINQELTAEQQRLAKLQSKPQSDETEKAIQQSNTRIAQLEKQASENRLAIRQNENQKLIQQAQQAEAEAVAAVDKALASGTITKEQAEQRKLKITETRIRAEIEAEKQGENDKAKLAQLNSQLYQNQAAQREAAEKAALDRIVKANEEAEAAIAKSQQDRIIKIREAQLGGGLSEAEAAKQIEKINLDSSAKIIEAKKQELAQTKAARESGKLDAKEAADLEKKLQTEIGQATLSRLEQELAARRKAATEAIDLQRQQQTAALNQQTGNVQGQLDLLSAQSNLISAINGLENERLQTQIKQAEATGNTTEAERLREQAAQAQIDQQVQALDLKAQELALSQQLRDLEQQRAVIEAEANVQKAQASGAAQQEIASLQQIADLEQQKLQRLQQVSAFENQALDAQRRQTQEKQKQLKLDQQAKTGSGSTGGVSVSTQFRTGAQFQAAVDAQRQVSEFFKLFVDSTTGITKSGSLIVAAANRLATSANDVNSSVTVRAQGGTAFQSEFAGQLTKSLSAPLSALTFNLAELIKQGKVTQAQLQAIAGIQDQEQQRRAIEELIKAIRGNTEAQQDNGIKQLVSSIKPRRDGGPVTAGRPYLVGEVGPELIVPSASGYVLSNRQSMAALTPAPTRVTADTSLLREIKGLRSDMRKLKPSTHAPTFNLVNRERPLDDAIRIQQGLMRARYGQ